MVHKKEKLTAKSLRAQKSFIEKLEIRKRKTAEPLVVAMVGLVGSGKSSIAKELAKHVGATIIEGDKIRVELRGQKERYEQARAIAESAVLEVIKKGGNAILDSDFVDDKKRASLRKKLRPESIRLVFVRTHCDLDVMVGRILTATYNDRVDDFFGGASSKWKGGGQSKGAIVKTREMWRRTPNHYRWSKKEDGKWILKKFPFAVFAEIDTTSQDSWKRIVAGYAQRLLLR